MGERGEKPVNQSMLKTSQLHREAEGERRKILPMKKPPNPVKTEEEKSKDEGNHLIDGRW